MSDKELALALLRQDLGYFTRGVFAILFPKTKYVHAPYIDLLAERLTALQYSKNRRLVINLPPRHLKSTIASVAYCAWLLGHNPSMKVLCVSYSADLAIALSKQTRQVMESDWYQLVFPATVLVESTQDSLITNANGERRAVSVHGAVTGFGADCIIIDDPQKADEVSYAHKRAVSLETLKSTILTRLNDPTTGTIVLVQQRLHEDDWSAAMLASGVWDRLSLPAIAEVDEVIPFGKKVFKRTTGEALHPLRVPITELEKIRAEIGSADFSAQYQQRPVPGGGAILDIGLFPRYDVLPKQEPGDLIVHSWDVAYTIEKHSDYSVVISFVYKNYRLYVRKVTRFKKTYPELREIIRFTSKQADYVVIEGSSMGLALWQELHKEEPAKFWRFNPKESKDLRLMRVMHLIETGRVVLPRKADYLEDFLHELASFPNGKHDDQVDCLTQALWLVALSMPPPPPGWTPPEDEMDIAA